jgi:protein-S-isoprenylcysteine O-methyltransferase Ste14
MSSIARPPTFAPRLLILLTAIIGGSSLALFGAFLLAGPFTLFPLNRSLSVTLAWDTGLSLLFFAQHSGMVRAPIRARIARAFGEHHERVVYGLASGAVLLATLLLWQRADVTLYAAHGLTRAGIDLAVAATLLGFVWGFRSLRGFDPFGTGALLARLRGVEKSATPFVLRGPYRWVRHPLYFLMIVLFWATPELTADRLLFNLLWTGWMVLGTWFEERDLVAELGDTYRQYQRTVPMLLPWRGPAASSPAHR